MQEVIIARWCDACWQDGEQKTESTGAWTVGIVATNPSTAGFAGTGGRPALKLLELCEQHGKLITDLVGILAEVDATPGGAPAAPVAKTAKPAPPFSLRTVPCPVCATEVGRSNLVQHIWAVHRKDQRPDQPTVCPECGERYDDPRGMATHRRTGHGHDAVVDALAGVKGYKMTGREGGL